jgi:hypothetical protein
LKLVVEVRVPSLWSLLEAIESFVQSAEIGRVSRIHKTQRLPHVYFLLKNTMQERILDIQLMKNPSL